MKLMKSNCKFPQLTQKVTNYGNTPQEAQEVLLKFLKDKYTVHRSTCISKTASGKPASNAKDNLDSQYAKKLSEWEVKGDCGIFTREIERSKCLSLPFRRTRC